MCSMVLLMVLTEKADLDLDQFFVLVRKWKATNYLRVLFCYDVIT